MYTFYSSPGTSSLAIHVLLNELGQKFKLLDVPDEGYSKINPAETVPVLIEGSKTYIEAAAIALHLLWKHRSPILPEDQGERESRIEWMMFANATVYMAYRIVFFVDAEVEEPKSNEKALSIAIERLNKLWEIVEHQLEKTNFLCGDTLSVGDIMLTVYSNWNQYFPGIKLGKNTKRMIQEVSSRESFKKALADEGSEFNVR